MKLLCSFLLSAILISSSFAKPFYESAEKGWFWYKEEKLPPKKKEEEKKQPKAEPVRPLTSNEQIKKMREEYEEILATALLNPTLENVTLAKNKQLEFEERSQQFSDVWVLSHLLESKGYSHQGNPHPWHQQLLQKEKKKVLGQKLRELSKHYGLFFAFKESCPYCHQFAPVVARFAREYGFEIKGISADGGVVEGIDNLSKDNGALSVINPEGIYPALFLANPKTMEVIPIAWGMVTTEQLLNNLEVVLQQLEILS